jgi:LuxR family maltose regulon positive regulatory protein
MSIPIMITKVVLPSLREEILSRKRLTSLFEDLLNCKLIIVTAPAGYGKTSLLLDVAHHNELPFCWYTLDTLDKDIVRFLAHYIASITRRFPAFGEQSQAVLQAMSQGSINVDEIGIVIVNEIYQTIREHFVIVLDDYQMVDESQTINHFINRFIQSVDQNCHVVITSRSVIPLPELPLMVGRSLVGGLGLPELAFQPDEIQALMLKNYQQVIPEAIAVELAQRTEGWITGLLLSAQTMWQGMVNQLRLARVSGVDLSDYLMQEVLNQQPEVLRDFLLRTSFLDEFNADLCAMLFDEPPPGHTWRSIVDNVLRHNLFVLPVGESGSWLHYHRLFSDFLQAQFMKEHPCEVDGLLQRLIDVFAEREEWENAYHFCQRLGKPEVTADLIEKAGETMVINGRISLLRSWLEVLPVALIRERPILLARYGIVLATQKETTRGIQMLDQSVAQLREANNQFHLAGTLVWRALAHYLRAEYRQALDDVNEVFSMTKDMQEEKGLTSFQAEAYRISGQCYRMMGNVSAATKSLNHSLELFKRLRDHSGINRLLTLMGLLHLDTGNFKTAMICYQQVFEYYQKQQNIFWSASVLNDIAYLHYLKGDYAESFAGFNDALIKARQSGNARVEGLVLIGLGDIFTDLAEYSEAIKAYNQGGLIVENIKEASLLIYIDLAKAAVARQQGDYPRAHLHLNSARLLLLESKTEFSRGFYLLQTGLLELAEKEFTQAVTALMEANQLFVSSEQRVDEIRASCLLAFALYEINQPKQASQYFAHACQLAVELDGSHILIQTAFQGKGTLTKMASSEVIGLPAIHLLDEVLAFEVGLTPLKRKLRAQDTVIVITPPKMRIQAFGQIQVMLADRSVTGADWQTQVTQDLLFLVLSNRNGWSKERIGEFLWPESSLSQLNQRFKNTIYRLRRALNQDVILYFDGIYSFNRKIDYEYDVEEFENFLTHARTVVGIEAQITAFQTALQIYRGDYLPGMEGEWVIPERERLLQAFLNTGLRLAELFTDTKQYPKALELCNRLISEAPWLEEAYRLAMNLNAYEGNRAAISQLYKNLQHGLLEYSDTFPSPQTEGLYQSLMA